VKTNLYIRWILYKKNLVFVCELEGLTNATKVLKPNLKLRKVDGVIILFQAFKGLYL